MYERGKSILSSSSSRELQRGGWGGLPLLAIQLGDLIQTLLFTIPWIKKPSVDWLKQLTNACTMVSRENSASNVEHLSYKPAFGTKST